MRRALSLSILSTVLLWPQTLRKGGLAPSDDSRAEFTKLYSVIDAAYNSGHFDDVAVYLMPDAVVRRAGQDIPFRNALAQFKQVASEVTWKSKVVSVVLNGESATVTVESEFALASPADKQDFRGTSQDIWILQSDGWRLQQSEWLKQERVVAPTDAETTEQVVRDLRRYAVRLVSVEPGKEMGDLAAFGRAVGDARIVALGEASHGTREFFQMKHRLLEYLVQKKGFTVFAIEANWPESLAVDRYIKSGKGDPKAAIQEMYFWTWYTQEVLDLIEWMRAFNKAPGDHPILTFTSFDMQTGIAAAAMALDYLRKVSPEDAVKADPPLNAAAAPDGRLLPDPAAAKLDAEQVAGIVTLFDNHKAAWIEKSSLAEWRDARHGAEVVRQSALNTVNYGTGYRDQAMARDVEWLADEAHPGEKIVLWAANGHISYQSGGMGDLLRRKFGGRYHVLGFSFRRGQVRAMPGPTAHSVPAAPQGTGNAVLGTAGMPLFYLDLRAVPNSSALGKWLTSPHLFVQIGAKWSTDSLESNLYATTLAACYDSFIFVDEGHATVALTAGSTILRD